MESLQLFLDDAKYADEAERLGIADRLGQARSKLADISSPAYLKGLVGTLGADPLAPPRMLQQHEVSWGKAKLSPSFEGAAGGKAEALGAYRVPSLLERFTSRFRKTRASHQ